MPTTQRRAIRRLELAVRYHVPMPFFGPIPLWAFVMIRPMLNQLQFDRRSLLKDGGTEFSVHGGLSAPIESAAENRFDDEVVGGAGGADADPEIDFPYRRDVEIGDEKELMLLVMRRGEATQGSIICVVLEAGADDSREV